MFENLKLIKLIFDTKNEEKAAQILLEKNLTLSVAESCTGGLVSSLMTDISGSSSYIKANFVTYANEAKMKFLNVKEETLKEHGAVSVQTASEMAEGLLKKTDCDYALCTTGIAGPNGGSLKKPVGLVYIGIGKKDKIKVFQYNVNPKYPRILIKYLFAKHAVKLLADYISDKNKGQK